MAGSPLGEQRKVVPESSGNGSPRTRLLGWVPGSGYLEFLEEAAVVSISHRHIVILALLLVQ